MIFGQGWIRQKTKHGFICAPPAARLLFSALSAAALAQPTKCPSDHERGQQERDDQADAGEHIDENNSGAVADGHDARGRLASMPL